MNTTQQIEQTKHETGWRSVWREFNDWRKRYRGVRVLLLCILLAAYVREKSFLPWMVNIAVDAILSSSEPSLQYQLARSRRADVAGRLQRSLRAALDRNGDGRLDASEAKRVGVDAALLRQSVVKADLGQLLAASQRLGLVQRSYTFRRVFRDTLYAARAEREAILKPNHERIAAMTRWWARPDYTQWATWTHGAREFGRMLTLPVRLCGSGRNVLSWSFACVLAGLIAASLARRRRSAAAGAAAAALALAWYGGSLPLSKGGWYCQPWWEEGMLLLSLACASAVLGLLGARLAARLPRAAAGAGGLAALGMALLAWGLIPPASSPFPWYEMDYFFGMNLSGGPKQVLVLAGVACVVAASLAGWRMRRRTAAA